MNQPGHDHDETSGEQEVEIVPPPQRIRVAWLLGDKTLMRYSRFIQPMAVGLMDELIDILCICPDRMDVSELPSPPMEILRHDRLKLAGFYTGQVRRICKILADREVKVIHAMEGELAFLAAKLSRMSGIPYTVSSHALSDVATFHLLVNKPEFVISSSDPIKQAIIDAGICLKDRAFTVRPGLHIAPHTPHDDDDCRKAIVAGAPLLSYGRIRHLVDAFGEIHNRDSECMFFLVGSGQAEGGIRREILKLGLRHELTLVGNEPSSKLPVIFSAGNIYVSPLSLDRMDFWSLVAMSVGVPVVAVDSPASDHIHDGKTAVVVRPADATDLVIKIETLLANKLLATDLADSAIAYLREHHSAAKMVANVAKIYRNVAVRVAF